MKKALIAVLTNERVRIHFDWAMLAFDFKTRTYEGMPYCATGYGEKQIDIVCSDLNLVKLIGEKLKDYMLAGNSTPDKKQLIEFLNTIKFDQYVPVESSIGTPLEKMIKFE